MATENYYEDSHREQYKLMSHRGQSLSGLVWFLCPGSHKAEIKVSAGLGSYLDILEENPLRHSFRLVAKFSSLQL